MRSQFDLFHGHHWLASFAVFNDNNQIPGQQNIRQMILGRASLLRPEPKGFDSLTDNPHKRGRKRNAVCNRYEFLYLDVV
jgi:hypothetical protein